MSTRRGSSTAVEQNSILVFTPGEGERTVRVWKGPTAVIESEYSIRKAQGYSCTLRYGMGGNAILEASLNANSTGGGQVENPVESWSLFGNRVEKDILESDIEGIADISAENKQTIIDYIQNPSAGKAYPTFSPTDTDADDVLKLMIHGVRSVVVDQPVIRGTYLASTNYSAQVSTSNVGLRFTNAQLRSIAGVPNTLLVQLPQDGTSSFDAGADTPLMKYGWVKRYPTAELVGADQFRVSVEFEYGLWSTKLYPDVT